MKSIVDILSDNEEQISNLSEAESIHLENDEYCVLVYKKETDKVGIGTTTISDNHKFINNVWQPWNPFKK